MPALVTQLQISAYFVNNYNIMLVLTALCLIAAALLYRFASSKVADYALKFFKQAGLTLILFSLFQISFCAGIFWNYGQS